MSRNVGNKLSIDVIPHLRRTETTSISLRKPRSCRILFIRLLAGRTACSEVDYRKARVTLFSDSKTDLASRSVLVGGHWRRVKVTGDSSNSGTSFVDCLNVKMKVEDSWNVMAHAQKPDFVFRRNGRVHWNRRGRQFIRLLAAEVCASAVVMLDTPCSEVVWRILATHSIPQFLHLFPSRASPCAITFQLEFISRYYGRFEAFITIYQSTRCHITEDLNVSSTAVRSPSLTKGNKYQERDAKWCATDRKDILWHAKKWSTLCCSVNRFLDFFLFHEYRVKICEWIKAKMALLNDIENFSFPPRVNVAVLCN